MLRLLHEIALRSGFAVIIGACAYVRPLDGILVGAAGLVYITPIQRRTVVENGVKN